MTYFPITFHCERCRIVDQTIIFLGNLFSESGGCYRKVLLHEAKLSLHFIIHIGNNKVRFLIFKVDSNVLKHTLE